MNPSGSFEPIEVKVIYDASARRGRVVRRASPALRTSRTTWLLLAFLNLLAAGGLCYATWWRVDRFFIYEKLILKTPLPGLDLNAAAQMFGIPPAGPVNEQRPPTITDPASPNRFVGETARTVIGASAYSWLTLATIACCALALAAGAGLGHVGGRPVRLAGRVLAILSAGALVWAAWSTFETHGFEFPLARTRLGYAGLTLLCVLLGLAFGRRPGRLTRLAAVCIVLSAVGSVAALYFGAQCGAIEPAQASIGYLSKVFAVHSAYGWLLLPIAARLGR